MSDAEVLHPDQWRLVQFKNEAIPRLMLVMETPLTVEEWEAVRAQVRADCGGEVAE